MRRRTISWLVALLLVLAAAILHWHFWYPSRLRPAMAGNDLPSQVFAGRNYDSAVWIAHPHQNLPALSQMTGLDDVGLVAALHLAGLDMPTLRGIRIPPASSLAVAVSEGEEGEEARNWTAAAHLYPLAAAFARLSGALAGNPWLGGGTVHLHEGGAQIEVTIAWQGATWLATTGNLSEAEPGDTTPPPAEAIAWIRHRAKDRAAAGLLPTGPVGLFARDGVVELAATMSTGSSEPERPAQPRLTQGRQILDRAESLLVLLQRGDPEGASADQALLLLPLPPDTDKGELPRSALLHRPSAPGSSEGRTWKLPGEQLLDIAGRDLPRGEAAGWQVRASDAIALGSALAAAKELRTLAGAGLPSWGVWLDVEPAAQEIGRIARGLESSPFLRRSDRRHWLDAAEVLRSMSRHPARIEGFVDGDEMVLRWTARR